MNLEPVAPGAEIRVRVAGEERARRLVLRDAQGGTIPSSVEVHSVPMTFRRNSTYAALRPLAPLPPGDYSFDFAPLPGSDEAPPVPPRSWAFSVRPTGARHGPPAVRRLRARPVDYECVTGLDHACRPVREACGFVVLDFEDGARGERDVYEVGWRLDGRRKGVSTRGATVRGFASERTGRGGGISIPVGWFGNLDDATGRVSIELRALDDAGRAGRSASVSLPVAAVRALPRLRRDR